LKFAISKQISTEYFDIYHFYILSYGKNKFSFPHLERRTCKQTMIRTVIHILIRHYKPEIILRKS